MATVLPFFPTHWYYNTETGQLTQGNNLENLGNNIVGGAGWHELNVPGNATQAQAAAAARAEFPTGVAPTTAGITPARVASTAANQAGVPNPVGALTDINTFLSRLTSVNMWIRVGEFIVGAMLILAGALHLTGANADLKSIGKTAIGFVK